MRLSRRSRSLNFTGKVTPLMARTFSCASTSTARRKPCMKRCRSSSWPVKLNSTSGGARIARCQRDPAARHRLEQGGREIGDLEAERAPRGLALHVDVHVGRRRARQPGRIAERRHRDAAAAIPACRAPRFCSRPTNTMAWFDRFSPTPGRSARTSMPCSRRCRGRPDARCASGTPANGCRPARQDDLARR